MRTEQKNPLSRGGAERGVEDKMLRAPYQKFRRIAAVYSQPL